jgi:hypothetical protein
LTDCLTAKLLLTLGSTVILGSESHGTHGHILLSDGSGILQLTPQSQSHVTTDDQSVSPGFKAHLGFMTGY